MQLSPVRLVRAAIVTSVLAIASASDFELSQLDKDGGDFGFVQGDIRCPTVIAFSDDDFAIKADDIQINQATCAGGTLMLAKNPDAGGSLLTEALRKKENRDTSVEGTIGAALTCGAVRLVPATYFQVRPLRLLRQRAHPGLLISHLRSDQPN